MLGSHDRTWRVAGLAIALGFIGTANSAPNILLIIGDDMGVETVASYGVGENPPATAHLDDLARNGVRFDNFWSQPVCSPMRTTAGLSIPTGSASTITPAGPPEASSRSSAVSPVWRRPTTPCGTSATS